LWNLSVK